MRSQDATARAPKGLVIISTSKNTQVNPNTPEGADVLDGFEPIDKAALVGKPFLATGVRFRKNERDIVFAEVEITQGEGAEPESLQDSSTGVRDQLSAYLVNKGIKFEVGGDWVDIKLYAPRGLRVSEYGVRDAAGRTKQAKTYYLTTQGRRR